MKNYAWSFFNTFLSKGFSFIFSIILGNLLLPGDLGVFVTILLVITYLVSVFSFGIGQSTVQKLNDRREASMRNHYFSAGMFVLAVFSSLACLLFIGLQKYILQIFEIQRASDILIMVVWLIPLNIFREYFSRILQANKEFRRLTFYNLTSVVIQIFVTILLVYYHNMNLEGVFYGIYTGGASAFILFILYIVKRYTLVFNPYTLQSAFKLIRFSSLIFAGSFALLLDRRIDVLFVSHFLESSDVAIYNYALKFSLLFLLIGNSMSKVSFPKLTNAFSSGASENIERILKYSVDFSFLILSFFALAFLFNAHFLVKLMLPEYYLQAVPFLPLLFIGILPKAVFSSIGTLFTAKGIPAVTARINWIMLGVNIILNLILIPIMGLYGAAIATSVSFLGQPVFIVIMLMKHIDISFPKTKIILNFTLLFLLIIFGTLITNIWVKELIIVMYALYCFFIFLTREEKQYLLTGLKRKQTDVAPSRRSF
ncbi:MAG: oligosaccharide flippase family protein [Bacteroidales bacterium]